MKSENILGFARTAHNIARRSSAWSMSVIKRNNVKLSGSEGSPSMLFAHGFGCDQNMWRLVAPAFGGDHRLILFDHLGAGGSDVSYYDPKRYSNLEGYARDIIEIGEELGLKDAIFVGHSVSAIIGILASLEAPGMFKSLILIGPSPCYIDKEAYRGGFNADDIGELLASMAENHFGWSAIMAPVIMGNEDRPELAAELAGSFCKMDPAIAHEFARATFLSDHRAILSEVQVPTLILQCSDDVIAPTYIGEYMNARIPGSKLVVMEATGHCPNLSAPPETIAAIRSFL